jgi:hypothetical protein
MKTAMQDLKEDLQHTIDSANDALMEIENVIIRKACQKSVELTLKNVVKRIDDELLEKEKQQIIDAVTNGRNYRNEDRNQYYNETFKND